MLKLFKNFSKLDYVLILISTLLIIGQVFLDLSLPDYVGELTTIISSSSASIQKVLLAGGKMLLVVLGTTALACIVGFLTSKIASTFSYKTRQLEFKKITQFGITEMKKFSIPSLITRTTNDITQIQMLISMGLQVIIKAPILAIVAIIKIFGKSWELSAVVMICVFLLMIMLITLITIVMPKFKKIQKQVDDVNRVTEESLTGVKVIRAFNATDYQNQKFEKVNDNLTKTNLFTMRTMSILQPFLNLIMSGLSLAIYYVGSILINNSPIATKPQMLGDVVAFSSYGMYVIMGFMMLSLIFMILPRASVSAKRINEVLNYNIEIEQGKNDFKDKKDGTIEFKNVSYKLPNSDEYILKNVSFKANKGDTVAIIGASGSGKSTLVNLACRLYEVSSGQILLNGEDIKEYTFASLYSKIGYIPQKTIMFSDTVKNNITFGETQNTILEQDIMNAIDISQSKNFVKKMEKGIDSDIAQGGTNISGGQKQRLSIARAIARKPEILIFDDSFSALDFKTDKLLRKKLNKKLKDTTLLIVASRIGTIQHADTIIVLDEGNVVGIGTHKELLKNCKIYKEIALSQLSKEELKGE